MEDTKLSAEEIEQVISQFIEENYNRQTINLVREDLEFGLSKKQVEMYKSKKLSYAQRRQISRAMQNGVPDEVIARFSGGKYTEQQLSILVDEFVEGFELNKLLEIMDSTQSGYDMKEACAKVKGKLSNTTEKPSEPEPNEPVKESAESEKTEPDNKPEAVVSGISGQDFMETMKMMMDTFSSTVQLQFDRMDKRDAELRKASLDKDAEKLLNDKISDLESKLADSRKDLSAASGVVSEKEQQIKSMQLDMDLQTMEISEKDSEIKKLRKEMEHMKSENISGGYSQAASSAGAVPMGQTAATQPVQQMAGQQTATQQTATVNVSHTPNYTMNLTTSNGNQIPLQVERTERKSPFGLSSLMSKFLPKGPAKTLLTRMIEGRYSGEQLSEIVYAYDKKLDEAEVQELLDANLPPEEMHGIIEVVAAAKGGEQ